MTLPTDGPTTAAQLWSPPTTSQRSRSAATTAGLVATGSATDGHYGLFRWDMTGVVRRCHAPLPPHVLRGVLRAATGASRLYDGTGWREGGAGDFLYVPPRSIHAFRNDSGAPVSMLILFAPAPPREAYFRELAERLASGRTYTDAERAEFMARYDQFEVPAES